MIAFYTDKKAFVGDQHDLTKRKCTSDPSVQIKKSLKTKNYHDAPSVVTDGTARIGGYDDKI